jgi:hypothetical protein
MTRACFVRSVRVPPAVFIGGVAAVSANLLYIYRCILVIDTFVLVKNIMSRREYVGSIVCASIHALSMYAYVRSESLAPR